MKALQRKQLQHQVRVLLTGKGALLGASQVSSAVMSYARSSLRRRSAVLASRTTDQGFVTAWTQRQLPRSGRQEADDRAGVASIRPGGALSGLFCRHDRSSVVSSVLKRAGCRCVVNPSLKVQDTPSVSLSVSLSCTSGETGERQ